MNNHSLRAESAMWGKLEIHNWNVTISESWAPSINISRLCCIHQIVWCHPSTFKGYFPIGLFDTANPALDNSIMTTIEVVSSARDV